MCSKILPKATLNRDRSTIEEEIINRKKAYIPASEIVGPTTNLFFHELEYRTSSIQSIRDKVAGLFLLISYVIILPVVWSLLKLFGISDIFQKNQINGIHGRPIEILYFNTGIYQTAEECKKQQNLIQCFLYQTGLYKLPLSIPLLRGEITLKGPEPIAEHSARHYLAKFTDFYKRYAMPPGVITPASYIDTDPEKSLHKELKFISKQTSK